MELISFVTVEPNQDSMKPTLAGKIRRGGGDGWRGAILFRDTGSNEQPAPASVQKNQRADAAEK